MALKQIQEDFPSSPSSVITNSKAALPLKWNESAYVIPSVDNDSLKALVSKIPGGCSSIADLNWAQLSQQHSPTVCISGRCVYSVGVDIHSGKDLNADCFSLGLRDPTSNCQINLTVRGSPARNFPSPSVCDVYVITNNVQLNSGFQTQSQDVPILLQVDNDSNGCVIVISEYLYKTNCHTHSKVQSLLFVLETTHVERCVKNSMNNDVIDLVHESLNEESHPSNNAPPSPKLPSCKRKTSKISSFIPKIPTRVQGTSKPIQVPPAAKPHPPMFVQAPFLKKGSSSVDQEPISKPKSNPVPISKATPTKPMPTSTKPPPQPKPTSKPVKYTKLESVEVRSGKYNVCGVVRWCKPPSKTRGRDYYITFTLVDESIDNPVSVIAFNAEDKLPVIREGSIIILRNIKAVLYNENLQLNSYRFSTFHVFGLNSTTPENSSNNASLSQEDIKLVKQLQQWEELQKQVVPTVTNYTSSILALKDVSPGDEFGMIGIICHIAVKAEDRLAVITICDGTLPSFCTVADREGLEDSEYVGSYGPYMVSVFVHDPYVVLLLKDFSIGSFALLQKVRALPVKAKGEDGVEIDFVKFQIDRAPGSSIKKVSEPNDILEVVKDRLSQLFHKSTPAYPTVLKLALSPTATYLSDHPFVTISQVLANKYFPKVFRIYASPIHINATKVQDICDLYCQNCYKSYDQPKTTRQQRTGIYANAGDTCNSCNSCILQYRFGFTITLTDSTGQVQVTATNKEAMALQPNIMLCNLWINNVVRCRVLKNFKSLFGYDPFLPLQDHANVKYIDCAIRSSLDKSGKRVIFSFCDTVLVAEKLQSYSV